MKQYTLILALSGILSLSAYATAHNTVPLPPKQISAVAGHYSSTYGYVHVKPAQGSVFTNFNGRRITVVKKSDGFYYSTLKLIGTIPITLRMSLAKVNGLQRVSLNKRTSKKVVAQQFKATPISSEWMSRLGEYRARAINGHSKITSVKFETQNGVVLIRLNSSKYAYPLIIKKGNRLVRPTIGRARQRHIEVWPRRDSLAAIIGNVRFVLEKR